MSVVRQLGLYFGVDGEDYLWHRYVVCWLAWDLVGEPLPPWDLMSGIAGTASDLLEDLSCRVCSDWRDTELFCDLLCVSLGRLQQLAGSLGEDLDGVIHTQLRSW